MKTISIQQTLEEIKDMKRNGNNFQTIKHQIGEKRLKSFLKTIYPNFSLPEIEKITGVPDSSLGYWFEKLKIPRSRWHMKTIAYAGDNEKEQIVTVEKKVYKLKTIKISQELAYLIGFNIGDGNTEPYSVAVFNQDRGMKAYLSRIMKKYGNITHNKREDGLWRLRLSKGIIANLIKDHEGLRYDTLDYIFNNDKLARTFIAGFWDAEGTVRKQNKYNYYNIYVYNSKEHLLKRIEEFFTKKGIKCSKLSKEPPKGIRYIKGKRIYSKKIVYRLSIPKDSAKNWIKEIGVNMLHSKKSETVKQMTQTNYGGN